MYTNKTKKKCKQTYVKYIGNRNKNTKRKVQVHTSNILKVTKFKQKTLVRYKIRALTNQPI